MQEVISNTLICNQSATNDMGANLPLQSLVAVCLEIKL